jgi:HK97 family phage prohead protease|nr:MAG TPA: prohead protease [Caudoviricetes sp.]
MKVEIRADYVLIKGYVNAVERDSRLLPSPKGTFVEQVRAGTWQRAISENEDIALLLNHDWTRKLGSTKENLKLKEDNIGLYAEAKIYDADVIQKARNNELRGWSFGFVPQKQSWGKTDNDVDRRYLDDVKLNEVSIIDKSMLPCYSGTSIEARAEGDIYIETRSIEDNIEVIEQEQRSQEESEQDKKIKLMRLELEI